MNRGRVESTIVAKAGEFTDEGVIRKVEKMNMDYVLVETGAVLNWFDIETREGYFSLNDTLGEIMKTIRGKLWFVALLATFKKKMDSNKSGKKSEKDGENKGGGFTIDASMISSFMGMMGSFTILRLTSMISMANISFTKEELLDMNKKLNKIKKPKNKK